VGLHARGVAKYSDFGPIEGYISATVQDMTLTSGMAHILSSSTTGRLKEGELLLLHQLSGLTTFKKKNRIENLEPCDAALLE